jgi:hypothetical protein
VSEDLEQQLLTPAAGNSSLQTVAKEDLTDDRVANSWYFNADVMRRFCTLAKSSAAVPAAGAQRQHQCPQRCQVACCASFARGSKRFDRENDFEQCVPNPCALNCGLPGNASAVIGKERSENLIFAVPKTTATGTADVLKRKCLRASSALVAISSMSGTAMSGSLNQAVQLPHLTGLLVWMWLLDLQRVVWGDDIAMEASKSTMRCVVPHFPHVRDPKEGRPASLDVFISKSM